MADRIQQRRDTAAKWAQYNPTLLEGEVGYVLDEPNQYKIGDGVHAWNELPLRGFDGTLVHELGDSETSAMSQKGVTEVANKINSNTGIDKYPVFSDQTAYEAGNVVNYNGKLYQLTSDHAAGAWDESQVEETSLKEEISLKLSSKKGLLFTDSELINSIIEELYINFDLALYVQIAIGSNWRFWLIFYDNSDTIIAQFLIDDGFSEKKAGTVDGYVVLKNTDVTKKITKSTDKYKVKSATNSFEFAPYIYSYLKHKDNTLISLEFNIPGYIMGVDRNPHNEDYIEGRLIPHETQKCTDFINIENYEELYLNLKEKPESTANSSLAAGATLYNDNNCDIIDGAIPTLVATLFGAVNITLSEYPTAKYIVFNEIGTGGKAQYCKLKNNTNTINQIYKNKEIDDLYPFTNNKSFNSIIKEIYVNTAKDCYMSLVKGPTNNWIAIYDSDDNSVIAQFKLENGLQNNVANNTIAYTYVINDNIDKYIDLIKPNKVKLRNISNLAYSPIIYQELNSDNNVVKIFESASGLNFDNYLETSNKCIATYIDDDTASIESVNKIKGICDLYGIKCTFATILDRWYNGLSEEYIDGMKDLLLSLQDEGYNFANHSLKHDKETWKFQYLLENGEIDFSKIEADMCKSRRLMQQSGFIDCNYIIYPWGLVSGGDDNYLKAVKIADKYFDAGIATYKNYNSNLNIRANNPVNALTRMQIYNGVSESNIKTYVNNCYENNSWCIIYTHSNDSVNFNEDLLKYAINYIQSKGIEFKTLHEGWRIKRGVYQLKDNAS